MFSSAPIARWSYNSYLIGFLISFLHTDRSRFNDGLTKQDIHQEKKKNN